MLHKIPWREICKFLSGAFFVSAGVLFYLYLARVSVPLLGTTFTQSPEVSAARSVMHACFFALTFYVGFLRKPKHASSSDP